MRESLLDECPGISPNKKRLLLEKFGSVTRIKAASAEDIAGLPGISRQAAKFFGSHPPLIALNFDGAARLDGGVWTAS